MKVIIVIAALFAVAFAQKDAQVIHEEPLDIQPEGEFYYSFSADNDINLSSRGGKNGAITGAVQYVSPEGEQVNLNYAANAEKGFFVLGSHLPVAPEIPPQIQRALEYIAAHPPTDPAQGAYVPDV